MAYDSGKIYRHRAEVLEDKMYIFGGRIHSAINQNLLFTFDFKKYEWQKVVCDTKTFKPPEIDSHSSSIDKDSKTIYFFGGFTNGQYTSKKKLLHVFAFFKHFNFNFSI